jgi:hypothetical protein
MANRSSGENFPDNDHGSPGSGKARTITQLIKKYHMLPADEMAIPKGGSEERNFSYIDYGPPVILSDSCRVSQRTIDEQRLWANALGTYEPAAPPTEVPSLGARLIEHVRSFIQ